MFSQSWKIPLIGVSLVKVGALSCICIDLFNGVVELNLQIRANLS